MENVFLAVMCELSDYITRRGKNLNISMKHKMVVLILGYALA